MSEKFEDSIKPISMVMATEVKERTLPPVVQYTIPTQVLKEDVVAQRVPTQHSLSYPYIERNMSHNKVAEMRFDGKRWVLIAPYGSYTPTEHLMFMRWEPGYTPDPESIQVKEGKGVMGISADLAREIAKRSYNRLVIWSFHWSPYSFGQEGYQSIPTIWHPSIFGVPKFTGEGNPYMRLVNVGELKHKDEKSIRGGIYNEQFGRFLVGHALNGQFRGDGDLLNRLFVMDQAEIDLRGVRVPTRGTLEETLRTPGFFEGFLQPFAITMNQYAEDLSTAITDFDPRYVQARIEEAVLSRKEPEDKAIQATLGEITKTPKLLDRSERARRIQLLEENGYPGEFIRYLIRVNDRLPDSGLAEQWKRGFAYTFALGQDTETGQGFMAISVGIRNGPGGVVENVLGAKLKRPPNPLEREEMERKKNTYREIVGALDGSVIQTLGACPVEEFCTDFRRYGRRHDDLDCTMSGDSCLNDPRTWSSQYDRYLEARLDGRRPPVHINLQHLRRFLSYPAQE